MKFWGPENSKSWFGSEAALTCFRPSLTTAGGWPSQPNEGKVYIAFSIVRKALCPEQARRKGKRIRMNLTKIKERKEKKNKTDASNKHLRGNWELYRSGITVRLNKVCNIPIFVLPTTLKKKKSLPTLLKAMSGSLLLPPNYFIK